MPVSAARAAQKVPRGIFNTLVTWTILYEYRYLYRIVGIYINVAVFCIFRIAERGRLYIYSLPISRCCRGGIVTRQSLRLAVWR